MDFGQKEKEMNDHVWTKMYHKETQQRKSLFLLELCKFKDYDDLEL